jgi:hypothetical protein
MDQNGSPQREDMDFTAAIIINVNIVSAKEQSERKVISALTTSTLHDPSLGEVDKYKTMQATTS